MWLFEGKECVNKVGDFEQMRMISSNIFFTSKFPEMFPTEMRVSSHICIVFQKHESVQYIAALAMTDHHIKKCTRS